MAVVKKSIRIRAHNKAFEDETKLNLEQSKVIILNNLERDSLMSALDSSPKPNEALRSLFK